MTETTTTRETEHSIATPPGRITREIRLIDYGADPDLDLTVTPRCDGQRVVLLPRDWLEHHAFELTLEQARSLHDLLGEAIGEIETRSPRWPGRAAEGRGGADLGPPREVMERLREISEDCASIASERDERRAAVHRDMALFLYHVKQGDRDHDSRKSRSDELGRLAREAEHLIERSLHI